MDEEKIRELTTQARQKTDTKHAREMQKFQADLETLFSAELLKALGVSYQWGNNAPKATFALDDKAASISRDSRAEMWDLAIEGSAGESVAFTFTRQDDFLIALDDNREHIRDMR
jgi:hypothetical protein